MPPPGVLLRARHWVNWPVVRTVFFFHLVWPSTEKFILQRSSVQKVLPACENQLPYSWKRQWNPYPPFPPPSPPSLTPVPLTRHYDKYSINPAWSAATYWRAFILTACTKEVNLPICISLHLPCAPFWGPLIACVLSGHI